MLNDGPTSTVYIETNVQNLKKRSNSLVEVSR